MCIQHVCKFLPHGDSKRIATQPVIDPSTITLDVKVDTHRGKVCVYVQHCTIVHTI